MFERIYSRANLVSNVEGGVVDDMVFHRSPSLFGFYYVGKEDDRKIREHGRMLGKYIEAAWESARLVNSGPEYLKSRA